MGEGKSEGVVKSLYIRNRQVPDIEDLCKFYEELDNIENLNLKKSM